MIWITIILLVSVTIPVTFVQGQTPIWAAWGPWGACSKTCDVGYRVKYRGCVSEDGGWCRDRKTQFCHNPLCTYNATEKPREPEPDITWLDWQEWSECTKSCGGGTRKRIRTCSLASGITGCTRSTIGACNSQSCSKDSNTTVPQLEWEEWSEWSVCSEQCGRGIQTRERRCKAAFSSQASTPTCNRVEQQTRSCTGRECEVFQTTTAAPQSKWSPWNEWSSCSTTCGNGTQNRRRTCQVVQKMHCVGRLTQQRNCKISECPEDSQWNEWENWSRCSVTCGSGIHRRTRSCGSRINNCEGPSSEYKECGTQNCAFIDFEAEWSAWGPWRRCSAKCGEIRWTSRTRRCVGKILGRDCAGSRFDFQRCEGECPDKELEWSIWEPWSECSATCDGGTQSRFRQCDVPGDCLGENTETMVCNTIKCELEATWTTWTAWSECSVTCGQGSQSRTRECNGNKCAGMNFDSQNCSIIECAKDMIECAIADLENGVIFDKKDVYVAGDTAVFICDDGFSLDGSAGVECLRDGMWSTALPTCRSDWTQWNNWDECSSSCGGGEQRRSRTCIAASCSGPGSETRKCNEQMCQAERPKDKPTPAKGITADHSLKG